MGRPPKEGLDYMTIDVDMFNNKKVRLFRSEFPQGEDLKAWAVFLLLLARIYGGKGYYLDWDEDEKMLFSQDIGITPEYCDLVVQAAVKRLLFDPDRYEDPGVLTSAEITSRFFHARKYSSAVLFDEKKGVSSEKTRVSRTKTGGFLRDKCTKDRIVKDRKGGGTGNTCIKCGATYYGDFCKKCGGENAGDIND
jgi:hypothetical protein